MSEMWVRAETVPAVATVEEGTELARKAERDLFVAVLRATVIATPICIAIWIAIMYFAIEGDGWGLGVPFAIAAVVGVIAGVFFGGWAGFLAKAEALDEADRKAARHYWGRP